MNEKTRWRPKGWKAPELVPWGDSRCSKVLGVDEQSLFESGADAMLEALKNKTSHPQVVYEDGKRTGILIFMPDEAL